MRVVDPSRSPDTGGIPRWVRVSGIIVLVVILLVVVMLLLGGGHRPRRHGTSGEPGGRTLPASVTAPGGVAGLAARR
jgi:hypothetical protein